MAQVIIRNLDDAVLETLRTRAKANGRSLEEELRQTLARASRLTPDEKVALAREIRTPARRKPDSTAIVRRLRDR